MNIMNMMNIMKIMNIMNILDIMDIADIMKKKKLLLFHSISNRDNSYGIFYLVVSDIPSIGMHFFLVFFKKMNV